MLSFGQSINKKESRLALFSYLVKLLPLEKGDNPHFKLNQIIVCLCCFAAFSSTMKLA